MSKNLSDTRPFHFKPFSLYHHKSTMKTGTDAILLGVWADVNGVDKVLDIGCGCGIISLLIASRCEANITAIDIDEDSILEASANFENSNFSSRMNTSLVDFKDFSSRKNEKFDLIISNPPFFENDLKSKNIRKASARHTISLSYHQLCEGSFNLLNPQGKFCLVLPYEFRNTFMKAARNYLFYLNRELIIFPRRGHSPNRVLLEFTKEINSNPEREFFSIREENNKFSKQYHQWLENYYLSIPEE